MHRPKSSDPAAKKEAWRIRCDETSTEGLQGPILSVGFPLLLLFDSRGVFMVLPVRYCCMPTGQNQFSITVFLDMSMPRVYRGCVDRHKDIVRHDECEPAQ